MNRELLRFPPVIVPSKCWTRGCDNTAEDEGREMYCRKCHEELAALAEDRAERARQVVDQNLLDVRRKLRRKRWRGPLEVVGWVLLLAVYVWFAGRLMP